MSIHWHIYTCIHTGHTFHVHKHVYRPAVTCLCNLHVYVYKPCNLSVGCTVAGKDACLDD